MQEIVKVKLDGVWYELSQNSNTGKYEIALTAPEQTSRSQEGGIYEVDVEAIEKHGLPSTGTYPLTVRENTPPELAIIYPDSAYISENCPEIRITVSDEEGGSGVNPDTVCIAIDNGEPHTGESYTVITPLAEGIHTVTARARDNDGNQTEKTVSFTVDTEPPILTVTEPQNNINTNRGAVAIKGNATDKISGVKEIAIWINGAKEQSIKPAENGDFAKTVRIAMGSNQITIRAEDNAGNQTEIIRTVRADDDWIDPVWWRTEDDVEKVKIINGQVGAVGLKGLTPDEYIEWTAGLLGALNAVDLNRIEHDEKWLEKKLYELGYGHGEKEHKTDWKETDFPRAEEMERIRENVQDLITIYYTQEVVLPESLKQPNYEDINAVERILYEMKGMIELMEQSYTYCGVPYCGQGVSL